jgi:hypothetical protein
MFHRKYVTSGGLMTHKGLDRRSWAPAWVCVSACTPLPGVTLDRSDLTTSAGGVPRLLLPVGLLVPLGTHQSLLTPEPYGSAAIGWESRRGSTDARRCLRFHVQSSRRWRRVLPTKP